MEKKNLQFKTNLNCGGCIAKVQSELDHTAGICAWHVDTAHQDKVLTIQSVGITEDAVVDIIKRKGFKAEPLSA